MLDQATSSGDGTGGMDDAEGPGMTSSMPPGDGTTGDATSSSVNGESSSSSDEPPAEVAPPCELGGPGPEHEPAVQWGIVCTPFSPPLTVRAPYDFTVTRLVP